MKEEQTFVLREQIPPLHLAASTDEIRFTMTGICCRNGHLCATDANVLVHVPAIYVLGEELAKALEGKIIPPRIYKHLYTECKKTERKLPHTVIVKIVDDTIFVSGPGNTWISAKFIEGKFPDWENVWNDTVALDGENIDVFAINASLLHIASKAMGVKFALQLYVKRTNSGILLAPNDHFDENPVRGLIAPSRISDYGKVNHGSIQKYMPCDVFDKTEA